MKPYVPSDQEFPVLMAELADPGIGKPAASSKTEAVFFYLQSKTEDQRAAPLQAVVGLAKTAENPSTRRHAAHLLYIHRDELPVGVYQELYQNENARSDREPEVLRSCITALRNKQRDYGLELDREFLQFVADDERNWKNPDTDALDRHTISTLARTVLREAEQSRGALSRILREHSSPQP